MLLPRSLPLFVVDIVAIVVVGDGSGVSSSSSPPSEGGKAKSTADRFDATGSRVGMRAGLEARGRQ